ncbi:cytidine deaminase [Oceanispirochaeta crateris]|uniref:Cytidine deaminase n=1 Tax=Oceanispirochaeta crateris TaxID=2518645 RepID=A0A5C1QI35_9SPIO|nr:cytidine deaminase [Oceanispirochaeta crateris]QEN07231.1 cytidine deaminase [Oceanispirochaeta crateris]
MQQNEIAQVLFSKAKTFIENRYPTGWGGAAVLRTVNNNFLISIAIETCNAGASLCIETGAICEAHKLDEAVTHSICVVRDSEKSEYKVLTPCGICQERLMYWDDVYVGVTDSDSPLKLVPLRDLQPFHWSKAYDKKDMEFYSNR